ncbi:hypothetical protein F5B21DRAFT_33031 [Xylaria acuta]|nr:hypothetical protein F5B21DRAFT_33031 [Xylaria acuta]
MIFPVLGASVVGLYFLTQTIETPMPYRHKSSVRIQLSIALAEASRMATRASILSASQYVDSTNSQSMKRAPTANPTRECG